MTIDDINQFIMRAEVGTALLFIAVVLVFFVAPRFIHKQ